MRDHFDFSGPDLLAVLSAAARVGNDLGGAVAASAVSGLMHAVKLGSYHPQNRLSDEELGALVGHPHSASVGRSLRLALMDDFGNVTGTAGILVRRSRNTRNRRWERERKRRQRADKVSSNLVNVAPGTATFQASKVPLSHPRQKVKRLVIKRLGGKLLMGGHPSSLAAHLPLPSSRLSEAKTSDEPASQAHVLAPLARARRVVVCKRSSPRVACEPVVLAASSHSPINHAAMKSRREARDAGRKARTAETRVANAADKQRRAQERQSLGVTAECVPAAAVDQGALCEFAEGLERDSLSVKEAKRAYLRYRDLAGSPINSIAVPHLRAACLAQVCCRFGLSAGKVLEHLHRMHHEQTGNSFAGVVMLAPAALDGACSRATSKGKPASARGAGRPSISFVDGSVVDPRVIEALRANEAGPPPGHLATEEGWARVAVENAKLRASGFVSHLSGVQARVADIAAEVLGLPKLAPASAPLPVAMVASPPKPEAPRPPHKSAAERQRERDDALLGEK